MPADCLKYCSCKVRQVDGADRILVPAGQNEIGA